MSIKTWLSRLEVKPVNTSEEIETAMQDEIDELRAALQERDAKHLAGLEVIALHVEAMEAKLAEQRRVLEQALEALENLQGIDTGTEGIEDVTIWCPEVITAIQGVLA